MNPEYSKMPGDRGGAPADAASGPDETWVDADDVTRAASAAENNSDPDSATYERMMPQTSSAVGRDPEVDESSRSGSGASTATASGAGGPALSSDER